MISFTYIIVHYHTNLLGKSVLAFIDLISRLSIDLCTDVDNKHHQMTVIYFDTIIALSEGGFCFPVKQLDMIMMSIASSTKTVRNIAFLSIDAIGFLFHNNIFNTNYFCFWINKRIPLR